MTVSEKVAKILLDVNAISLNAKKPFRYTSGIISPIYTDCRLIISLPKERKEFIKYYLDAIKNSKVSVDTVAGTATAGIPWASWIADALNLPMIYVRGNKKDHGKGNQIEGVTKKGMRTIVIEDLISTGGSSVEAAKAIKDIEGKVSDVFSIITYGMKKAEINFRTNGIKLTSLTDFNTVLRIAQKHSYIEKIDYQTIQTWAEDPASWGEKMGFSV